MSTLFLSKPNENLAGSRNRGLSMHDDVVAEQIKDTWYRANNIDKIKAREKKVQLAIERGNGPFTAICDWLMVTGETVKDKASWRKATVVAIDDDNNRRKIRYADNGAEIKLEVYQLEIFAQNNDIAMIFRDWFQSRSPRFVELPPIRQHGEDALCSVLNGVWDEEVGEVKSQREMSPIEIAFISQRLMLGTIDHMLKQVGIDLDAPNSASNKQFAFQIAGQSELPRALSTLAPLPKGGEMKAKLPLNKSQNEVTPWGVANLCCVPLWWDSNSSTLRSIQSILRHQYYRHYAHWADAQLLGSGKGIKEEDNAAVLVLITMVRLGPPVIRNNNDRVNGLQFDVTCKNMTTLLQAFDLVSLPMSEPMHLHSPGFSWPSGDEEDLTSNTHNGRSDDNVDGYYRHAPRQSSKSSDVKEREQLIINCCVKVPIVTWRRESKKAINRSRVEELVPHSDSEALNLNNDNVSDNLRGGEEEYYTNEAGGISVGTSYNDSDSIVSKPYQSVRDSLIDSRRLESELADDLLTGFSSAMLDKSVENPNNFLLTSNESLSGNTWGERSGNIAAQERKEADKYSVVLNNTTNSYANASLWSESFKEQSSRPLNHHVLTEPPTVYHPSQAMSEYDDSDQGQGVRSLRPRNITPRSPGGSGIHKKNMDTPGQQARFAASKFKTTDYDAKSGKKTKDGSMFESPSKIKSKRGTQPASQTGSKTVSSREAEDTGHRLAYRATASKWAGPIAGKERGYGKYQIRSTTRRVVDGPKPTEQHGKWERPSIHDVDGDEGGGFHSLPPARARWETKALRLANAYDVPEKPSPYPTFKVGEKVRAQSFDQPHAWFDAKIVTVSPDITGNPAAAKYSVRYEGYKQSPSGTSLGKNLPVEMIKGESSMKQMDR